MLTGADVWYFNDRFIGLFILWVFLFVYACVRGLFKKRTIMVCDVIHMGAIVAVSLMIFRLAGEVYYKISSVDVSHITLLNCTSTGLIVVGLPLATVYIIKGILKIKIVDFPTEDENKR